MSKYDMLRENKSLIFKKHVLKYKKKLSIHAETVERIYKHIGKNRKRQTLNDILLKFQLTTGSTEHIARSSQLFLCCF